MAVTPGAKTAGVAQLHTTFHLNCTFFLSFHLSPESGLVAREKAHNRNAERADGTDPDDGGRPKTRGFRSAAGVGLSNVGPGRPLPGLTLTNPNPSSDSSPFWLKRSCIPHFLATHPPNFLAVTPGAKTAGVAQLHTTHHLSLHLHFTFT